MKEPILLATGSMIDLHGIEWIQNCTSSDKWTITFRWKSGNTFHEVCSPEVGEQLIKGVYSAIRENRGE